MPDTNSQSDPVGRPLRATAADRGRASGNGLVRKLAVMASGTAASVVLLLLQSVVIARLLGPSQLGHYAPLMAAIVIAAQLNDFGLANAFAYYARHRPGTLRRLLRILGDHMLVCAVAGAGLIALAGHAGMRDVLHPWWFAVTAACAIAIGTPNLVLPVLILARGEYRAYTLFVNGTTALYILTVLAVGLSYGPTWRGFIVASVVVQSLLVLLQVRFLLARAEVDGQTITRRECYRFGLQMKWAEVMKLLGTRLDLVIIAAILPASQVGQYSLAVGFREAGMLPLRTYGAILQNLLVDRHKVGADAKVLIVATVLMQFGLSMALWGAVAVALAWVVPVLYGAAYAAVAGPAAILFGSTVFLSIAGICFIVFNMAGRPSLSARVVTAGGLAAPPLVWVLSRQFGLYGAASAALLSTLVTALLAVVVLIRVHHFEARDLRHVVGQLPTLIRTLASGLRAFPRFAARSTSRP